VIFPQQEFLEIVRKGYGVWQIAKELGTSEFLVRRNLHFYSVKLSKKTAMSGVQAIRKLQMGELDKICPGLSEMPIESSQERQEFLLKAYRTYLKCLTDAWFLKDLCLSHFRYATEKLKLPLEEISWSDRRHEVELAMELLNVKIPFYREYPIPNYGKRRADFAIVGTNLLIEIDGDYHKKPDDEKRDLDLVKMGYRVIRFPVLQVRHEMASVVKSIQSHISLPLPPSSRVVVRKCGTSK
jgi:very-short-patch-repair endonuclease